MEEKKNRISRMERNKLKKEQKKSSILKFFKKNDDVKTKRSSRRNPVFEEKISAKDIITVSTVGARQKRSAKNKQKTLQRIYTICIDGVVCIVILYIGTAFYFSNHFFPGSKINNLNVSGKTVESVTKELKNNISDYVIKLKGRNNETYDIAGKNINIQYNEDCKDIIADFKNSQSSILWPINVFKNKSIFIEDMVTFHDDLLDRAIEETGLFNEANIIESVNPKFEYNNGFYSIIPPVYGTKIDKDLFREKLVKAIKGESEIFSLEEASCYDNPKYYVDSPEVIEAKKTLDKYVSAEITYALKDDIEVIDGELINTWIHIDDDLNISLKEEEIEKYLKSICSKYTTLGKTRSFRTTSGQTKSIVGGNYGWLVKYSDDLKNEVIENIKNGSTLDKDLKISQDAFSSGSDDIGNTYVEIDMTSQHLWFYKNGGLVTQGDVVTGNVSSGFSTPAGTYRLNYKERNATLKGENYSSDVSYWMPFNNNIGIHDASWRDTFGGNIYLTSGSHGCVNAPTALASVIFNNIEPGTPIVCYY